MTPRELLEGVRDGNFHAGGIRCLRLLQVHSSFFADLRDEVAGLCQRDLPSDVRSPDHVTNWTRPRGEVLQFSLFNRSGRVSDFSADHDLSSSGKRFHLDKEYPRLASFIGTFPDITNFRVNILGPGARLAAHEEYSIIRTQAHSIGASIRYHLPVATNQAAELTLDGHVFHLEAGTVYLVNHGCVHAVRNADMTRRVHLIWDQLVTRRAYDAVFGSDPDPAWGSRIPHNLRTPLPRRIERMGAHMRLPLLIDRIAAEHLELCDTQ